MRIENNKRYFPENQDLLELTGEQTVTKGCDKIGITKQLFQYWKQKGINEAKYNKYWKKKN